MGGGGGKGHETRGQNLMPFVTQFEGETRGVRQNLLSQINEAMSTGGIGARAPIIGSATTQLQNSIAQALSGTRNDLARSGNAGTPFGDRALAGQRMTGATQISAVGPNIAQSMIQQGGSSIGGTIQSILGALAGQGNSNSKNGHGGLMTS